MEEKLRKLGFGKNDIKVYLALFDLGKTKAGAIIDHTGLHRNLVYTALEELAKRKLVTKTVVRGVATFVANDPKTMLEELENKKQLAQQVIEQLQKKQEESPQEITVYEGIEGIRRARNQTLNMAAGSTLHVLGASHSSTTPEWERYWKSYHTKREKKGIGMRILYEQGVAKEVVDWRDNLEHSTAKYLPFLINSPMEFNFINDYVYLNIMSSDTPMAIKLRSKTVADAFRKFFDFFWDQKVQVYTGADAVKNAFYSLLGSVQKGDTYRVLGASGGGYSPEMLAFFETYHADRIKKGVTVEMLASHEYIVYAQDVFARGGDEEGKISILKPFTNSTPQPFQINLYNGKTQIIVYEDEPVVLLFENEKLFEGFSIYFDAAWNQTTRTLSGHDGIKTLGETVLAEGKDIYLIGATGSIAETHEKYYEEFTAKRIRKNMALNMLAHDYLRGSEFTTQFLSQVTYLPKDFESPMVIWVFGDYVANVMWHDPQTIVLIHDAKVAQAYRTYYNALATQARK